jgi:hypothetical protein
VALWLVIDPCVNFGRVYCDFLVYIFLFLNFFRHQTMDEVQKYNSFNTNTPSSESYRNYSTDILIHMAGFLVLSLQKFPYRTVHGSLILKQNSSHMADHSPPCSTEVG